MIEQKKKLKEANQAIPTPKSILNYKDDDVVAAIKKEVGKNKDFTVLKITHNATQYYNVIISYIVPDEDWSFELDKYRYIQQLHQYRVDLFTELSKVIPVVNVNLAAFDFVKGNEEIKFALTILLSNTNNKDWVSGRVKQKVDQKERLKLLQTESKQQNKKTLKEIHFEPLKIRERQFHFPFDDYKQELFDAIYEGLPKIGNHDFGMEDVEELFNFYQYLIKHQWYEGKSVEETANIIMGKLKKPKKVEMGEFNEAIKNELNEFIWDEEPSTKELVKNERSILPMNQFQKELIYAIYDQLKEQGRNDMEIEDVKELIGFYPKLIKKQWYNGRPIDETASLIVKKVKKSKAGIEEDMELNYEFQPANVPGTPTTDEDFLECDGMTKTVSVKENELVEGKLYQLIESNGLITDTVQYIKKIDNKYLFEKTATGRKLKLSSKDVLSSIKKVMKKKSDINEGWKKREEFEAADAFKSAEHARKIPGVLSANAITQNKLVITFDGRKLDGLKLRSILA